MTVVRSSMTRVPVMPSADLWTSFTDYRINLYATTGDKQEQGLNLASCNVAFELTTHRKRHCCILTSGLTARDPGITGAGRASIRPSIIGELLQSIRMYVSWRSLRPKRFRSSGRRAVRSLGGSGCVTPEFCRLFNQSLRPVCHFSGF